jgi:integrase/recombinase XerD
MLSGLISQVAVAEDSTLGHDTLREKVAEYLEYVEKTPPRRGGRNRKRSPATVTQYRWALRVFLAWADRQGLHDADDLSTHQLERYAIALRDEPGPRGGQLNEVTQGTYIRSLNLFLKWLGSATKLANPTPPDRDLIDQVLTRAELAALKKAAPTLRDRLIVDLLSDTGCRVGELANLRVGSIAKEPDGTTVIHLRGKTGERWVAIDRETAKRLRNYLSSRPGEATAGDPVFLAQRRRGGQFEPITTSGVQQLVRNLAKEAGISKRVYPHLLRHSFATHWIESGKDSVMLANVLGHKDLTMILRTYAHPSRQRVGSAMLDFLKERDAGR